MASLFQGLWPAFTSDAAPFVSHKDTKPRRGRTDREAAFPCNGVASRAVDGGMGLSAQAHVFVPLCEKYLAPPNAVGVGPWMLKRVQHDENGGAALNYGEWMRAEK